MAEGEERVADGGGNLGGYARARTLAWAVVYLEAQRLDNLALSNEAARLAKLAEKARAEADTAARAWALADEKLEALRKAVAEAVVKPGLCITIGSLAAGSAWRPVLRFLSAGLSIIGEPGDEPTRGPA